MIKEALQEDRAFEDITSRLFVPEKKKVKAQLIARQKGVLSGLFIIERVFKILDNNIKVEVFKRDGESFETDEVLATITGNAGVILAGERTALNFLSHLSGIASFTARLVEKLSGTDIILLDTRKTTPLLRKLEKEAVRNGGGKNHRMNLAEMVLIKDNHIKAANSLKEIVNNIKKYRQKNPQLFIEVEVSNLEELKMVLKAEPSRIMLDNFPPEEVRKAVQMREELKKTHIPLEISGGITEENITDYARCGCEYISMGALTHSAGSISFSLEFIDANTK